MAVSQGAAVAFIQQQYGGLFEETDETVAVGATATKIVDNDPDALALVMVNLGSDDVYVLPANNPTSTQGIWLGASGGSISMNVRDDLTLPTLNWYGITKTGSSDVYFIRIRRYNIGK